jgi:hypothetical protein
MEPNESQTQPANESENLVASASDAGGTSNASLESKSDSEKVHDSAESTGGKKLPAKAQGFFAKLVNNLPGVGPACNCKQPGERGQHKLSCPKSKFYNGTADRRFAVPVVSGGGANPDSGESDLADSGAVDSAAGVAPKKPTTFYRKGVEMLARGGSQAVKMLARKRLDKLPESIMPATARDEEIESFGLPDEDLQALKDEMDSLQAESNLPHVGPGWTMGLIAANYGVHTWIRFMALDRRLALIQAELEKQNRLARAARKGEETVEKVRDLSENAARPAPVVRNAERAAELELDAVSRGGGE